MKYLTPSLIAIACSLGAHAQTENKSTTESIERVEVFGVQQGYYERDGSTALRQKISLLETPQSVFIINDALIKDQQSFRIDKVLLNDASVQKSNNFLGAYSSFQIRGFDLSNGSNYLRNGRPFFQLASPPVEVLERIEVLKGPSSVLYGTMAPGGLVNMSTKRANRTSLQGFVKATVGSDDFKHIHLDLGSALNDSETLRYRANLVKENGNSHRRFFDGSEFETDREIISLNVEYDLSPDTVIRLDYDDTNDDRPQDAGLFAGPDGKPISDNEIIFTQPWSTYNSDVRNFAIEVEHYFNDQWSIKAGIFDEDYERDRYDQQYRSFDTGTGDVTVRTRHRINRWNYQNAFVDVSGRFKTGDIEHQILVGADATKIDLDNNETSRNETYVTNIFNPVFIPDPMIPVRDDPNLGETNRSGLFVQDNISLTDNLNLLIGLRYDDFDTYFQPAGGVRTSDYSVDNVTPRVGLVYMPTNNQSWYVSFSQSFEPNAPVADRFDNSGDELDPTFGDMYEIGYKWENLEGNVIFSSAIFDIERRNVPFETPDNRVEQRGTQRHKGAEAALTGLIGNISITGSLALLNAEFTEDENPDLIGNTPVAVPDFTAAIWAEYQLEGDWSGLSLQAGWRYEAERPMDNANTFNHDAFHKIDIGAKYEQLIAGSSSLVYRLSISNVSDEIYYKSRSLSDINLEAPRLIRASVEYVF